MKVSNQPLSSLCHALCYPPCHPSRVPYHLSHVPCHPSRVPYRLSHVPCHPSRVPCCPCPYHRLCPYLPCHVPCCRHQVATVAAATCARMQKHCKTRRDSGWLEGLYNNNTNNNNIIIIIIIHNQFFC